MKSGQVESEALGSLAQVLGVSRRMLASRLRSSHCHDWIADPFARGAYSYARVGGSDAPRDLSRPVQGTVFIAGEATDREGRTGTVHGAMATGQRAAEQVIETLARPRRRR